MNLRVLVRTDLNLLISLLVLLEEQHVGRAAQRLYVTQSAMSKMLSRLRIAFDDELFIRLGQGVTPTPRALELYAEVQQILHSIEDILTVQPTSPSEFHGDVIIQTSEFYALPLLPKLIAKIAHSAPKVKIKIWQEDNEIIENLVKGKVDIGIINRFDEPNIHPDIIVETLINTNPIILMRKTHPLKSVKDLRWEHINNYKIVLLRIKLSKNWQSQFIKYALDQNDLSSNIILETPNYLSAIDTLINTDCIMFAPRISLDIVKQIGTISTLALPQENTTTQMKFDMIYHKRTKNSFKNKWLRGEISRIYNEVNQKD